VKQKIHVAIGVIRNKDNQYLISKRHTDLHQGGLWEFPGGKVETNESTYAALCRELYEELDIVVKSAEPFVKISYAYPDKNVYLDVWLVDNFDGTAKSKISQPIKWVSSSELLDYQFPIASKAILRCISLSPYYAITGKFDGEDDYTQHFKKCLNQGVKLIQLRYQSESLDELVELANISKTLCLKDNAKLIVNANIDFLDKIDVDGIHLNSSRLFEYSFRPIDSYKILVGSVHNVKELEQAIKIDVDFVVVSPVLKTQSHPDARPLGWNGLKEIIDCSSVPVFSLGGMRRDKLSTAKKYGAFGVAAISDFWNN